jgi:hypothetical protein
MAEAVDEKELERLRYIEEIKAKYGLGNGYKYFTPDMVWSDYQLDAFDGSLPRRKLYEALKQAGGGPISIAELAKLMGNGVGAVASCLRSMEKKGLVKRGPDKKWEINPEYMNWEEL